MLDRQIEKLMREEQKSFGIQPGFKQFSMAPFGGMNQMSTSRLDGKDSESWWQENLIKTGDGCLRSLWDQGPAFYTAPTGKTIIYYFFYNIGPTNYVAIFLSDGTAVSLNTSTGASTTISSVANTFYDSGLSTQIPVCGQWGTTYLLIANNFGPNNYWVWDGSLLYTAGSLSPLITITDGGVNYTSAPTVTAYGGSGSGATFVATVLNGSVVSIRETNPGSGYEPGDVVQLYITGGGSDSNAELIAVLASGAVTGVVITNPGSGYLPGTYNLIFTGGTGSGATGTYTVGAGGTVDSTAITAGGSGYTGAPSVTFPVPIKSVTITNPGSGYTPGTYALGFSGGGGTGAAGTYTVGVGGTVASTAITVNGSGYTSVPSVTFPSGGGAGAAGTAVLYGSGASGISLISSNTVSSVTIVHGGSGFTSTPTLTFIGGGGTGATATAVLSGGVITSVTVNNGGSGYTSAPAIEVQAGANNAAVATVTLMPYGISGTAIETFQQRVWLTFPFQSTTGNGVQQNGEIINISAPGSFSDFATSDGGLEFINSDSFLRTQYINIKQSNGYLYSIADSSVSVISNVQTSGNPTSTTFNYQNTDPQTGAAWRDTVVPYSRTILLANAFGVFGLYGGAVTKISKNMDNIFNNAVFPAAGGVMPTSAVANIFNLKVYLINMTVVDPFTEQQRTLMLGWDEREWFIVSQASTFTFISTQEVNSNLLAWGTDGNSLYQMFSSPSTLITKKLSSKLFGAQNQLIQKEAMGMYLQVQDLSVTGAGVSFNSITVDAEHGVYPVPQIPTFGNSIPPYYQIQSFGSGDIFGCNLGYTLVSTSTDFSINYLSLGYTECGNIAMSSTPIFGQISTE